MDSTFEKTLNDLVKTQLSVFRAQYKCVKGILEVYSPEGKLIDCVSISVENIEKKNARIIPEDNEFLFQVLRKLISTNIQANYKLGEQGSIKGVLHMMSSDKKQIKLSCHLDEGFEGTLLSTSRVKHEYTECVVISDEDDTSKQVENDGKSKDKGEKIVSSTLKPKMEMAPIDNAKSGQQNELSENGENPEESIAQRVKRSAKPGSRRGTSIYTKLNIPDKTDMVSKPLKPTLSPGLYCIDCRLSFNSTEEFNKHLINVHIPAIEHMIPAFKYGQSTEGFFCKECGKVFAQKKNIMSHIKIHHPVGQKDEKRHCPVCALEGGARKIHQHLNSLHLFRKRCIFCGLYAKRGGDYIKHCMDKHPREPALYKDDFVGREMKSALMFFRKHNVSNLTLSKQNA